LTKQISILIVDDDPSVTRLVRSHLEQESYHVRSVATGQAAVDVVADAAPDLVILDPLLSSSDGYTVCEAIRAISRVPVVMLAAEGEHEDTLRGFAMGADDYLTAPFNPRELIARVRAVLARSQMSTSPIEPATLYCGEIAIDLARHRVTIAGEEVKVTSTEYRLFHYLARNAGKVLSHTDLLTEVWGSTHGDDRPYLWVYIRRLRRKFEPDPDHPVYIRSEPGFGYVLECPPTAQ
jgi:DNA-binding response OmpR family regulator